MTFICLESVYLNFLFVTSLRFHYLQILPPKKETLHLELNELSGNVDFLCQDLPSDFQLDCDGDKPEVACTCCVGCTIVNDTECDPETEKLITLDIYAGNASNGFKWELYEYNIGAVIAAGGNYDDGQQLNIQLCLSFPGRYQIDTSADVATPP